MTAAPKPRLNLKKPPADHSETPLHIRLNAKRAYDRIRDLFGGDDASLLLIAAVVGAGTGLGAIGFRRLVESVSRLCFGGDNILDAVTHMHWSLRLLLPPIGLLIAWALTRLAPETKGHGVPEVMLAVAQDNGRIRPRVVLIKSLASAVTIGTGGSVGREGPIVQIGSALGSVAGQVLQMSHERIRLLVACGAAAGIAATFNAPMAGVIFAIEIILGSASVRTFSPIVISAVMATSLSRRFVGDHPAFHVPPYALVSPAELLTYVALGVAAGLVGVLFVRMLYATEDVFEKIPGWSGAIIAGLLVGAMGLILPDIYGLGYESIEKVLHANAFSFWMFAALLVAKLAATSLTLAGSGSGGIFAPSLFLGAMLGGTVGAFAHAAQLWPTAAPAAYALVGMAALTAATTHAPLTAIIIIFELTGDYQIILPVMLASIIASVLSVALQQESIYTLKLVRRGIDISKTTSEVSRILARPVTDLIVGIGRVLRACQPLPEVIDFALANPGDYHYVVDSKHVLLGTVLLQDLKAHIRSDTSNLTLSASDVMRDPEVRVFDDDSFEACLARFQLVAFEELPVVDRQGRFGGIIRRRDILSLYERELRETDDLGLMFVTKDTPTSHRRDYVELPEGYSVDAVKVPARFVGKTLRELDLHARHELLVVEISDGPKRLAPAAMMTLKADNRLVVEGPNEELQWLRDGAPEEPVRRSDATASRTVDAATKRNRETTSNEVESSNSVATSQEDDA